MRLRPFHPTLRAACKWWPRTGNRERQRSLHRRPWIRIRDCCCLPLDRPQYSGTRARLPALLSAAAHGLYGRRDFRSDRHRRHLLRQRLSGPVRGLSCRVGILGGHSLGAQDAVRTSGRSVVALEKSPCLFWRRGDCGQSVDHGRPDRSPRGDGRRDAGRSLVRAQRVVVADRLCDSGHGGGRDDGRGRAQSR